jgi:hypothetical protein
MTIATIFELLMGVLKFPEECSALIKLLSKTPEEKHQDILKRINAEEQTFSDTGRPS